MLLVDYEKNTPLTEQQKIDLEHWFLKVEMEINSKSVQGSMTLIGPIYGDLERALSEKES